MGRRLATTEGVPRDQFTRLPNDARHPVIVAVDRWMEDERLEQTTVAERTGVSYQRLNKMLSRVRDPKPQLDIIMDIERAYDLPLGYFLRLGGHVADALPPDEGVKTDLRINRRWRETILNIYQAALAVGPDDDKDSSRGL